MGHAHGGAEREPPAPAPPCPDRADARRPSGEADTRALHAGMPAVAPKWVAQVWIRQSDRI